MAETSASLSGPIEKTRWIVEVFGVLIFLNTITTLNSVARDAVLADEKTVLEGKDMRRQCPSLRVEM